MKRLLSIIALYSVILLSLHAEILSIEKNGYALSFDTENETYSFSLDGREWPLTAEKDNISGVRLKGSSRVKAHSIFSLTVIDVSMDKKMVLNSMNADSVVSEMTDDSSLLVSYSFEEGITVPVLFSISECGLHISIDTMKMIEAYPVLVFEIAFLPCFSSSSLLDDGWFLVPDGEGALLRFNSGHSGTYRETVYGSESADTSDIKLTERETVRLPLFGVMKNGQAALVVAEGDSAATAEVVASSSSSSTPYNTCCFNFVLRSSIEESISSDAFQVKYEEERLFNGILSILITDGGDSLVTMADKFSSLYITQKGGLDEDIVLNWEMAESKSVRFLGVPLPFKKAESDLSYEDVLRALQEIKKDGVSLILNLEKWNSDEVFLSCVDSLCFVSSAGSRSERDELFSLADNVSLALTPCYEKSSSSRVVKDLSSRPVAVYDYLPASSYMNKKTKRYLVRPDKIAFEKFTSSSSLLAFRGISEVVYADYNEKNFLSRADYVSIIRKALSLFDEYAVYGGNLYSLDGAVHVYEAPATSSFNTLSERVPFYQMVLSGKKTYSYSAINTSESPQKEILRVLETGAVPSFTLRNAGDVSWIRETVSEYIEAFRAVRGKKIVAYSIVSDEVRVTVYEDGTTVTVDYSKGEYTIEGGCNE